MGAPKKCGKCNKPKRPKNKKFKDKEGYCECGRPTVMTKDTLRKLGDAFSNGLTDEEACVYANIAPATLYVYQEENPKFKEYKEGLRLKPTIAARNNIARALNEKDLPTSKWYIEKKDPEFNPTKNIKLSGHLETTDLTEEMGEDELTALATIRAARRKRIQDKSKGLK